MTVVTRREKSVSERQHYQQSSCHWCQGLCQHHYRHFLTVIVAKTGIQIQEQRVRDEKSTLWKRLGETSRQAIPWTTLLSKSIGSDSNVLTSAAAFEKGWDNSTSSCKGSSAALIPWSTSIESSQMSIAYLDSDCAVVGDGIKRIQRWLTVHAVSVKRAWIKSIVCLTTANRRWQIIRIDL